MYKTKDFILYFLTLSKHVLSVVMHIPTLEWNGKFFTPYDWQRPFCWTSIGANDC